MSAFKFLVSNYTINLMEIDSKLTFVLDKKLKANQEIILELLDDDDFLRIYSPDAIERIKRAVIECADVLIGISIKVNETISGTNLITNVMVLFNIEPKGQMGIIHERCWLHDIYEDLMSELMRACEIYHGVEDLIPYEDHSYFKRGYDLDFNSPYVNKHFIRDFFYDSIVMYNIQYLNFFTNQLPRGLDLPDVPDFSDVISFLQRRDDCKFKERYIPDRRVPVQVKQEVVEFEPEAPMEVQEDANFNVEISMASDQDIKVEVDEAGEEVKKGNDQL